VLDDNMTDFDVAKPYMVSVHQKLVTMTQQGDETKEGLVRRLVKKFKIYEKRGGAFIYGCELKATVNASLQQIQKKYETDNNRSKMSDEVSLKARKVIEAGV